MGRSAIFASDVIQMPRREEETPSMVLELVAAGLDSDFSSVRRLGAALVSRVTGDDSGNWQRRLNAVLNGRAPARPHPVALPTDSKSRTALVEELPWPTEPLLMEEDHDSVLARFLAEAAAADRLAQAGLGTRLNLILSGPPGTGKTLTAGHIAARLNRPFHVARLDALVSSLLGDTAKNVRLLLDFVQASGGVLLLDEFDAIAKQRDDARDVGELKRVVNALLQALDRLDHRSVVIAATNHPQLLDPAVWRRFPYRLDMGLPGPDLRRELWSHYLELGRVKAAEVLARISDGMSCSDIREVALAARRSTVISGGTLQLSTVVEAVISCTSGKFILPRLGDLPADRLRDLRKKVSESHSLASSDVAALFQITRQGAEKSLKSGRRVGQDEVGGAGQSSSAAEGGRNPRRCQRAREV